MQGFVRRACCSIEERGEGKRLSNRCFFVFSKMATCSKIRDWRDRFRDAAEKRGISALFNSSDS